MDNELKEVLGTIIEKIDNLDKRLEIVEFKLDKNSEKTDDLSLDLKIAERNIRRDIRKLNDENETVIEVLKQHDILTK